MREPRRQRVSSEHPMWGSAREVRGRPAWRSLVLALAVGAGACQAGGERAGPPRVGDPLPDLQAVSLAGDTVTLDAYRGQAVLLNLWATWCPPCRAEMPYFQELSEEYGSRGLAVVGISVDDSGARTMVDGFLEESGVVYDILLDPSQVSMDRLGILGLPSTFLVDTDGVIRVVRAGPIFEGDQAFLDALEEILP